MRWRVNNGGARWAVSLHDVLSTVPRSSAKTQNFKGHLRYSLPCHAVPKNHMQTLPIRLTPGQDLRRAIEAAVVGQHCQAAFVVCGIGSLSDAGLRFAGVDTPERLTGDLELLNLSGTVAVQPSPSGDHSSTHLHMVVSTATGQVLGGHVAHGCTVRTTAEILLALLPEWSFTRAPDAVTGYQELVVRVASND